MNTATLRNILCCTLLGISLSIQAAPPASSNTEPTAGKAYATVWKIRGEVVATAGNATPRPLREGSTVYVGEHVRSAPNAEAVLKTADAGIVAVRPGAEFVAESFAAEGKPTDRQILRLITGSLRLISGWIGQLNRDEHKVITPQATIGIRGTDHEPYVLSPELAGSSGNREGTYDKVNRGGTTLDSAGNTLDIEPGKVGFVRAVKPVRTRAMMTLLLPVLLDKVPNFYVPGQFDEELDRYSKTADSLALAQLRQQEKRAGKPAECSPTAIGEVWVGRLDRAIAKKDVKTILDLFAADAVARATVRVGDAGGTTTLEFDRAELAESTLAAIAGLSDYKQRRISIDGSLAEGENEASCRRVVVKSVVIEQGLQSGKPYRFESLEEYQLELRDGQWLAVKAETTQR